MYSYCDYIQCSMQCKAVLREPETCIDRCFAPAKPDTFSGTSFHAPMAVNGDPPCIDNITDR